MRNADTPFLTRDSDEDDDGQFDIPVEAPDRQIGDPLSLRQLMGALPEKTACCWNCGIFGN
ncbi:MAG: hypothetical protein ACLSFT_10625 [Ruminococcus callidus]